MASGNAGLALLMLALLAGLGLAALWIVLSGRGRRQHQALLAVEKETNDRAEERAGGGEPRASCRRQLLLRSFEGDEHGQAAERVLAVLKRPFGGGLWGDGAVKIMTGHGDRQESGSGSGQDAASASLKSEGESTGLPMMQVALDGRVSGLALHVEFFPEGPVVMVPGDVRQGHAEELAGLERGHPPRQPLPNGAGPAEARVLSYECFDFPLFELTGLTRGLPAVQSPLLAASVAGLLSRGAGIHGQVVERAKLAGWAVRLEAALPGLRLTQPVLFHETLVVAAWCHLITGLQGNDRAPLVRALSLYERANEFDWHGRNVTEWAGIKANEAVAALALGQMSGEGGQRPGEPAAAVLYQRVIDCVVEGMRHFRRDNFPASWGKMMCKLALANGALSAAGSAVSASAGEAGQGEDCAASLEGAAAGREETHQATPQDYRAIARGLDQAIAFWGEMGDRGAIAEAHFAKGWLAQNTARRHMGLQNWERAENAYLAALAHSSDDDHWPTRRRADIRFELGRLYLGWGTRFGEKLLLEKAIHHFSALDDGGESRAFAAHLAAVRKAETRFLLAQAYLNYGGITNDQRMHERAVNCFLKLKDASRDDAEDPSRRREIDRAFCVARARLALVRRDRQEARQAISLISAVIGHRGGLWPSRDVLLRLRARLRELLFLLEGDDLALDRAINDRRELVANAGEGPRGLRWSVEVGDLVGLLSRRQYKLDGEAQDFHEAHYLLEKSISICAGGGGEPVTDEADHGYNTPHIEAGLHLKLGKLLASFARVKFDLSALNEAVMAFERFLLLTPRAASPLGRAEVLNDIGQIMMDRSEHYGQHDGLRRAARCFAEAHDIYLEAAHMDQANRMRRFLENAEAAILAYQVPVMPVEAGPVEG